MVGQKQALGFGLPTATLAISAAAIATYLIPRLGSWLVYDRAAILSGEIWRLVTGNLVHFSAEHLFYDLLAFGVAGWIIEQHGYRYFIPLCLLTSGLTGTALLTIQPAMAYFGGMSGVACAAVVYFALHGLTENGGWRRICMIILTLSAAKTAFELVEDAAVFVNAESASFVPVPMAHVIGALTAVFLFLGLNGKRRRVSCAGSAC